MMPDVVAQRSSSSAIDCPPSHASEHKTQTHQLSISLLSHSHTPATRSSPSARSATLSSTKPYRCPCNLVTSTASRSFKLSSAFLENAKEHDRMMPCFDRMSAVWRNHELGVRSTLKKASTYQRSPRECAFDLVRELWGLAECPVPSLPWLCQGPCRTRGRIQITLSSFMPRCTCSMFCVPSESLMTCTWCIRVSVTSLRMGGGQFIPLHARRTPSGTHPRPLAQSFRGAHGHTAVAGCTRASARTRLRGSPLCPASLFLSEVVQALRLNDHTHLPGPEQLSQRI